MGRSIGNRRQDSLSTKARWAPQLLLPSGVKTLIGERLSAQRRDITGAIALEIAAGTSAIVSLGAETIFEAPAVADIAIGVAAAVMLIGFVAIALNQCPIDPHFSKVPIPSSPKLSAVRPVKDSGLTGSVARAANAVLANQAETIGLLNALLTALDRADGASHAGDTSAEDMQLTAARDFAK